MNLLDVVVGKPITASDERSEQIGLAQASRSLVSYALSSADYGPLLGMQYIIPISTAIVSLLRMHEAAIREWGSIPEEILYDRMKTVWLGNDERGEIVRHLPSSPPPRLTRRPSGWSRLPMINVSLRRPG